MKFNPQPKPEKKPKVKKPKKTTSDAMLWRWFSIFIRLRDADENGYCKCITTGKIAHWKEMDAGHFISRRHWTTKYNEKNVHAQSRGANRFNQGMQYEYGLAIDRKYGAGTAENILNNSKITTKKDSFTIQTLTEYYKGKAKDLAKQKGQVI